ncbi:MAG: toll/interleukin-1 receptor domain-containing protein [Zavarzinella sp.]
MDTDPQTIILREVAARVDARQSWGSFLTKFGIDKSRFQDYESGAERMSFDSLSAACQFVDLSYTDFLSDEFELTEFRKTLDAVGSRQRLIYEQVSENNVLPVEKSTNAPCEVAIAHPDFDFDAFVSHASEDKADFVRPLVDCLKKKGLRIWYDEHVLSVGDSLREKIDAGLAWSRYGIVVVSPAFLKKNWTKRELNGLVAKQIEGPRVILPVWYNVTHSEVLSYSPPLADAVALDSTRFSIVEIAERLATFISNRTSPK